MAASDAIPVPRKNAAFRLYFAIRKNDGTLITSWTGADSEESLDGGAFSDCTNEATEIGTSGCGYLDLTAAEMNADAVVVKITVTNTNALPLVFTLFPESAGDYRVDSSNSSVGSVSGAVGSVTGAVGSVTGNVGGNVTGSVGSVVGAVGSVTGAVGSVTGNVGGNVVGTVASVVTKTGYSLTAGTGLGNQTANITGNLSGSVGSVTGAVGSVTGNVGGNVNGSVASVAGNVSGSVGSVTGAVGSVTGSVGSVVGNVGGSTASVAGAVGSVTGNVGGDVAGKVLGGGSGTISGDGVRAASVTGAVGSVTGSVGSVVGVGAIADAVWDEARTGHTTAGTFGFYLDAAISGISGGGGGGATAQEVWEYATRTLTGAVALDSTTSTKIDNILEDTGTTLPAQISGISGGGGSGTGARTVTITVKDGTNLLQNATVRFTEGVNTFTALTNASGVATFNLDDATYTVAITKAGYSYAGTTMVVNGTETATYSMTVVSVTPPDNPDLSAVVVLCLGTDFEPEAGVTIDIRIKTLPSGSTNTAYPGIKQTATSNGSGIATLEAPKGSVCEWKRGKEDSWTEITIGSDDQTNVTSIIGSRY